MNVVTCILSISSICLFAAAASSHSGRIIGGDDIPIEKVPYQISLEVDNKHECGGSIIASNYVVTAAHCLLYVTEGNLSIRAGTSTREEGGQVVKVKKMYTHPDYNGLEYDIAVLELAEDLEFSEKVAAVGLPSPNQSWPDGTEVLVSGWGQTDVYDLVLPVNLQGVTVELHDSATCGTSDLLVCAGGDGKNGSWGDSGGPLVADGVLIGAVTGGSGPKFPGYYASVAAEAIRDFITDVTGV